MKKIRLELYGHLLRMDRDRLTKRILEYFRLRKTETEWYCGMKIYVIKIGLKKSLYRTFFPYNIIFIITILSMITIYCYKDNFIKQVKEFSGFQKTEGKLENIKDRTRKSRRKKSKKNDEILVVSENRDDITI